MGLRPGEISALKWSNIEWDNEKRIIASSSGEEGDRVALYAGRRSAATLLVQLTGNAVAAQFVLRHKNLTTTTAFYIKPVQAAGLEGMKLVESTLTNRKALAESNGK
jgi:integrase